MSKGIEGREEGAERRKAHLLFSKGGIEEELLDSPFLKREKTRGFVEGNECSLFLFHFLF